MAVDGSQASDAYKYLNWTYANESPSPFPSILPSTADRPLAQPIIIRYFVEFVQTNRDRPP